MPLRQHATRGVCQGHSQGTPIFEPKDERRSNHAGNVVIGRKVERTLDAMRPGDRQPVARNGHVPRDFVAHVSEHFALAAEIPHPRVFLDEFHVSS